MRLIGSHAGSASIIADDREAWAQDVTAGLKKALNSYGLQANAIGTRLTPMAAWCVWPALTGCASKTSSQNGCSCSRPTACS